VAGDPSALRQFWRTVGREGTPLVEPIQGDEDNVLVTFVWRDSEARSNVCLDSPALRQGAYFARWRENQLERLEGTDLFYRSYRLPRELRASYLFTLDAPLIAPTDPPDEAHQRFRAFLASGRAANPDPLNPRTVVEDLGRDTHRIWSAFELLDAPRQRWTIERQDVQHGVEQTVRFRSEILDNERDISCYLPAVAGSSPPQNILLAFDAPRFLLTTLDNLHADGLIPPTLLVLISNPMLQDRTRELACHEPFAEFLATELMPWLSSNYAIEVDPPRTTVAGCSLGGFAASHAALRHPETFGNVLSLSGAYWWGPEHDPSRPGWGGGTSDWLAGQYESSPKQSVRFYLNVGQLETGEPAAKAISPVLHTLESNRRMRDVLLARGYNVTYDEYYGGHDWACWQVCWAEGILALARR
jgi:enterochelin esterase-like enzyme